MFYGHLQERKVYGYREQQANQFHIKEDDAVDH
jgi:hypothetical protein